MALVVSNDLPHNLYYPFSLTLDLLTPIETALELLSQIEEWCPPSLIPVCSQLVQSMVEIAQVVEDVCDVQIRRSAVDCAAPYVHILCTYSVHFHF